MAAITISAVLTEADIRRAMRQVMRALKRVDEARLFNEQRKEIRERIEKGARRTSGRIV